MQGHLHTSSGIERFVWLICFFAVYKQQTSPQLHCLVDEPQQKPDDGHQKITPSSFLISIHSHTNDLYFLCSRFRKA